MPSKVDGMSFIFKVSTFDQTSNYPSANLSPSYGRRHPCLRDMDLSINNLRVALRDCHPTLHALKCSSAIQMGISITVEVPSFLNGSLVKGCLRMD